MDQPICIFDLDDTLVDSWMRLKECSLFLLDEAGIAYDEKEMIERIIPLGSRKSAELYHSLGVSGTVEEILKRKNEKMTELYRNRVRPKAGVIAFLDALKQTGARMLVLSATSKWLVEICLEANRMRDCFEDVWSVEDFDSVKSEPVLFERVAERLQVTPREIHYFEDSMEALKNAKQVGFVTYAVENHSTPAQICEMKAQFDAFIDSFENFSADRLIRR